LGGENAITTLCELVVQTPDLRPVSREIFQSQSRKLAAMSDDIVKKIIVTAVALIGLAMWTMLGHVKQGECLNNCPTDFSASRR